MRYDLPEIEVRQTNEYARWFDGLRDRQGRFRILARIRRLSLRNPGDSRSVEKAKGLARGL